MALVVTTIVNYAVPPADGIRPTQNSNFNPISRERDRNFPPQSQEVQVENIRGKEDTVSLDTAGFQFYTIPTKYKGEFRDDEEIKREYYPESEELIKNLTGASIVVIFNHSTYCHYCEIFSIPHHMLNPIISRSSPQAWSDFQTRRATTVPSSSCRFKFCGLYCFRPSLPSSRRSAGALGTPFPDNQPVETHIRSSIGLATRVLRF